MKSVLVIDTPKSCSECEFKNCKVRNTIYDRMKAPQCPLRQLPSKEEITRALSHIQNVHLSMSGNDGVRTIQNLINTIYGSDEE